ncbi:MAG: hypothetical protein IJI25_08835 [Eubacterium sp.]|nr:hypothetical protein [Eubacterium sp.]
MCRDERKYNGSGCKDDTAFQAISNTIKDRKKELKEMTQFKKLRSNNRKVMESYGLTEQLTQLMEECAELAQAASKVRRGVIGGADRATLGKLQTDMKLEITDVLVLIDQIMPEIGMSREELISMADYKINRQLARMKRSSQKHFADGLTKSDS